jgi:hypothetical protein
MSNNFSEANFLQAEEFFIPRGLGLSGLSNFFVVCVFGCRFGSTSHPSEFGSQEGHGSCSEANLSAFMAGHALCARLQSLGLDSLRVVHPVTTKKLPMGGRRFSGIGERSLWPAGVQSTQERAVILTCRLSHQLREVRCGSVI